MLRQYVREDTAAHIAPEQHLKPHRSKQVYWESVVYSLAQLLVAAKHSFVGAGDRSADCVCAGRGCVRLACFALPLSRLEPSVVAFELFLVSSNAPECGNSGWHRRCCLIANSICAVHADRFIWVLPVSLGYLEFFRILQVWA